MHCICLIISNNYYKVDASMTSHYTSAKTVVQYFDYYKEVIPVALIYHSPGIILTTVNSKIKTLFLKASK